MIKRLKRVCFEVKKKEELVRLLFYALFKEGAEFVSKSY